MTVSRAIESRRLGAFHALGEKTVNTESYDSEYAFQELRSN